MSSDTPPIESVQDIQVRLKPIFGVEPKYYLAAIYSITFLAVLFALLLLPGIINPGTKVTVRSTPSGAAVTYGAKHWGTTPVTVFLPEGKAALTISKPGFEPEVRDYQSGNQLFASLFFPRSDEVTTTLKPTSETSVADLARQEIGRWTLAGPFTSEYRFPPLFTRFVSDAQASGWDAERIRGFLLEFRGAVADPQVYLDYGRALGLWAPDAPMPEGLEVQYRLWQPLVGEASGRLALWLLANQSKPVRDREVAEKSDWLQARLNEFAATLKAGAPVPTSSAPAALKTPAGSFRGIPASTYLWGSDGNSFPLPTEPPFALPVPVTVAAFWIAEKEVTQAEFASFVVANPNWAPEAKSTLVAAGWADEDYLTGWKGSVPPAPAEPVVAVSWYAARAYAEWVTSTGKTGGKKAVLPTDFQWEAAARAPSGSALLNQGVWEWTATSWYAGQSLVWSNADNGNDDKAYAHSLKGGIQSAKGSVKAGDRAGWPASGSTAGLGFRLALIGTP